MKVQAIVLPHYGIGDFLSHLPFINALIKKFPNDKFITKLQEFYEYCDLFDLAYPDIFKTKGDDYTSATEVGITGDSDVPHVFGHFLCDYHLIEPDVVAEIVKKLVSAHRTRSFEKQQLKSEKITQYNMGLYR